MATPVQDRVVPATTEVVHLHPVEVVVKEHVTQLQRRYKKDEATAVREVARLRRKVALLPYDDGEDCGNAALDQLWLIRSRPAEAAAHYSEQRPATFLHVNEERAENAVHLALTLWAVHQQSLREDDMHVFGVRLGQAVRALAGGPDDASDDVNEAVRIRFVRLGTSSSWDVLSQRLRELVLLLRGVKQPLDYVQLAKQLYRWQKVEQRGDVRREWSRSFHIRPSRAKGSAQGPEPDVSDPGE
ncbi:type I-E CRISPR-associated protein Cse2/CasB [Actinocorallia sp. A-T 12471]|uniref:type I-E CRISPR-associated protein Cse2/CasB n=1 Tax=Actinocorallia sp. A-T 12471 TaxID=3089813 RepID=UPI0029CAD82E|nr:type I-E CRISPR-associated protein Cse2/CasB [Actinocorallia sp. A-T 12471]MDX6740991.1 type I-E CRISPR-associated protein Cse2/CasB [Actinocorallia sp. A-T 12471]